MTVVVVLKGARKSAILMDAWIRACRCWCVTSNVFFSVILAISSGPGAFLGEILLMAHLAWFIVMMVLLGAGSR